MKSTIPKLTLFLPLLLLLVAATSPSLGAPPKVKDVNGHPVTTRSTYYILPVTRGNGGGLSLGQRNASFSCPLYVTQAKLSRRGLPVSFHPVNASSSYKKVNVRESTDMNVEFEASTVCVQSTVWTLSGVEGPTEELRRFVKSGGVKGNPGIGTLSNWFKIERDEKGFYKMVFCPSQCNFCKVVCGDLGVFLESGGRRFLGLAPNIKPLRVVFKKA